MGKGECGGLEGMVWKAVSPKGSVLPWRKLDSTQLTALCLPNPFPPGDELGVGCLFADGRGWGGWTSAGTGWMSGVVGDQTEKRGAQRARKEGC